MIIDRSFAEEVVQPRPLKSHKGTFGRVLLVGGNPPYSGAVIMAACACVNSGAGLVSVATDQNTISALHSQLPEAMAFTMADEEQLQQELLRADVVLIGPGLGEDYLARCSLEKVLNGIGPQQTLIIDGSALNLLAEKEDYKFLPQKLILTPHQKEWERLSGLAVEKQTPNENRAALAHFPSQTVLVAKSHQTVIYGPDSQVGELTVGGPYQATGGMGDTLAGMIAGFAAQFSVSSFAAAAAAAYLHSAIADQLSQTAYVVLPTRISQELPGAMKKLSMKNY
ncbi:NAD(P)H-hydrate dehydratase [Streptococcus sp. H49]|uniref:NAD(P)H-hydrate dehydratase n=1 Tax=Streptococcus huangxiaojuni TaxID=3237239 RepID=UPI0034A41E64